MPAHAQTEAEPAWIIEPEPVPYDLAMTRMLEMAEAIADGEGQERLWLLSHPPTITAGTSAVPHELLDPGNIPVVATGRGGRHTYHDPGQRIIYPLLDLARRGRDVRRLVAGLEEWVIAAVDRLGVAAHRSPLGTGVWVTTPMGPVKIAAIGLRVRRWVSLHGVAINIDPDMRGFDAIVPCGIQAARPGRLVDLNPAITRAALDAALFTTRHHLLGH
ncbi:lipoyl(octanoyl) transferase LipB [Thermaurantiacus sp.]